LQISSGGADDNALGCDRDYTDDSKSRGINQLGKNLERMSAETIGSGYGDGSGSGSGSGYGSGSGSGYGYGDGTGKNPQQTKS